MLSKEERRLSIINAAIKVFCEYGFHKSKMEDIAKEAGIGKGTIYEYFDSKKNLFQEMIIFSITYYKKGMKKAIADGGNIREKLIELAKHHGKFLAKHAEMAQNIGNQSNIISKEMRCKLIKGRMEIHKIVEGVIEEGINNGELRSDLNKELAAFSVMGTVNQYYTKKIFIDKEMPNQINPTEAIDILMKGIEGS
ncbi:TetR/AcrR family transcriptional regulator [Caldisalinibacter kiritimatiensis]|uniref:Transcriptional regulator, TetR family n=1 Tax=Caldisalinibacter kiritimatiensis TaxID=1304284 RepID=R1AYX7_9FIRM|nr:TetR/AcrR family transcriptional regulator [Caldisalinibacter kiritimatiensis]EOD01907.1 transcriptional regulator, TetR family [Caldisalinibacter kiritimatiensis]